MEFFSCKRRQRRRISITAGYVRFALFTSGYGYSPPSATPLRDINRLKL